MVLHVSLAVRRISSFACSVGSKSLGQTVPRKSFRRSSTRAIMTVAGSSSSAAGLIERINNNYETVHKEFEDSFWAEKMGLKESDPDLLARKKTEWEAFLGSTESLAAVREALQEPSISEDQKKVLQIMEKTFKCYIIEDPKAVAIKEQLNKLEADLGLYRMQMPLGYTDPVSGEFKKASSVLLANTMANNENESVRKACFEGLRSIGPYVVEKFCEIVKLRNALARLLGFVDFYDYKVSGAEGFSKDRCFELLEPLKTQTRQLLLDARAAIAQRKGESALNPWNLRYALSGDVELALDPYFPFEDAVDVWGRSFAALGIRYQGATMRLDLLDREGKYSNGFCHWPQPAWRKADGSWQPSAANFTSLASPAAVGSGKTGLQTLMHEGGHAAHFANIDQPSPLFSQERAPMSVAYAENQSMFLDAYVDDAAWAGRYARSRDGEVVPWELLEKKLRASQENGLLYVAGMLAVPYFEKALYELPEEEVTPERVLALADEVEELVQTGRSPRPLMSVPHLLADESSAYYHGYVLADMSVFQTREHFKKVYGQLVDNPAIGRDLAEVYWKPGNSAAFLDLVEKLTGAPLSADAWVANLKKPLEVKIEEEKAAYDESIATGPKIPPGGEVDLGMNVIMVHGDEVIADSREAGGYQGACSTFKKWVRAKYFDN